MTGKKVQPRSCQKSPRICYIYDQWYINVFLELMQQYATYYPPQNSSGIFSKLLLTKYSEKQSVFNFQIFLHKCKKHEGSFSSLLSNCPQRLCFSARIKIYQFENRPLNIQLTYKHVGRSRSYMCPQLQFRNVR